MSTPGGAPPPGDGHGGPRGPNGPDGEQELLYPLIAAMTGSIGLGASLLQYVTSGPLGIWLLLVAVGVVVTGVGLGFVRRVRLDTKISGAAAALGAILSTVALLGALGMLQLPDKGPGRPAAADPGPSPTTTTPVTPPPTTEATTPPTDPEPASDERAVSLTVDPADANLNVKSQWKVNEEPAAAHVRFLVAVVPQVPASGAAYTDFFPKAELGGKGKSPTSATFSLRAADPHSHRKVVVISVPESCAADLRQLISYDAPRTGTPCPGSKWTYDSKAFDIAKP